MLNVRTGLLAGGCVMLNDITGLLAGGCVDVE